MAEEFPRSRLRWRLLVAAGIVAALALLLQQVEEALGVGERIAGMISRWLPGPICDLSRVRIDRASGLIALPGGLDGELQIKRVDGYGVYFLGRLDPQVTTSMRRGGYDGRPGLHHVDGYAGPSHLGLGSTKSESLIFRTPGKRAEYHLFVDLLGRDTVPAIHTQHPLTIADDLPGQNGVKLDTHGDSTEMKITWQCRNESEERK